METQPCLDFGTLEDESLKRRMIAWSLEAKWCSRLLDFWRIFILNCELLNLMNQTRLKNQFLLPTKTDAKRFSFWLGPLFSTLSLVAEVDSLPWKAWWVLQRRRWNGSRRPRISGWWMPSSRPTRTEEAEAEAEAGEVAVWPFGSSDRLDERGPVWMSCGQISSFLFEQEKNNGHLWWTSYLDIQNYGIRNTKEGRKSSWCRCFRKDAMAVVSLGYHEFLGKAESWESWQMFDVEAWRSSVEGWKGSLHWRQL